LLRALRAVAVVVGSSGILGCGTLGTAREPIVVAADHPPRPVVQLRRATLPQPLTFFAVHYWFAAWDPRSGVWERWEVWQQKEMAPPSWGHVHENLTGIDSAVGGGEVVVERQWVDDDARALISALHASPSYPDRDQYRAWPGPNSNSYVAWVLRESGVGADLDPRAIGKDWRGWVGGGLTTTGTGFQVSTPLIGFAIGLLDGFQLEIFCLTFGLKPVPPNLLTPVGRIGAPEQ
jgi:hypothetical protein